jgi:hypothetical protein
VVEKVSGEVKKSHAHYVSIGAAAFDKAEGVSIKLGHYALDETAFDCGRQDRLSAWLYLEIFDSIHH